MRHIRKTDANVSDHRFRSVVKYLNKARPTFCGASDESDVSRKDALHFLKYALVPAFASTAADLCPNCVTSLKGKSS